MDTEHQQRKWAVSQPHGPPLPTYPLVPKTQISNIRKAGQWQRQTALRSKHQRNKTRIKHHVESTQHDTEGAFVASTRRSIEGVERGMQRKATEHVLPFSSTFQGFAAVKRTTRPDLERPRRSVQLVTLGSPSLRVFIHNGAPTAGPTRFPMLRRSTRPRTI